MFVIFRTRACSEIYKHHAEIRHEKGKLGKQLLFVIGKGWRVGYGRTNIYILF